MRGFVLIVLLAVLLFWAQPGSAQDACAGGIALQPGMDIAGAVNGAPAGSTFCFSAGEYSGVHITPRNGDRYICAEGAVFNGGGRTDGLMRAMAGANNPANVMGVTLSGCTIRNYGSDASYGEGRTGRGAVEGYSGWTIENNRFENNAVALVFSNAGVARDFVVRNNAIVGNSEMSLLINGTGFTLEGNLIEGNGFGLGADTVSWYGSLKITCQPLYDGTVLPCDAGGSIRGNTIRGNNGNGLWFDLYARGIRVEGNDISGNTWNGVMCEICYDVQIVGNTLTSNGTGTFKDWLWRGGQIMVANGSGVNVSGNRLYVTDGTRGLILIDEAHRSPRTTDTQVVENTIVYRTGAAYSGWGPIAGYSGASHTMSVMGSTWDRNTYCGDAAQQHWYHDGGRDFAGWQALGFDTGGRVLPASDGACG